MIRRILCLHLLFHWSWPGIPPAHKRRVLRNTSPLIERALKIRRPMHC